MSHVLSCHSLSTMVVLFGIHQCFVEQRRCVMDWLMAQENPENKTRHYLLIVWIFKLKVSSFNHDQYLAVSDARGWEIVGHSGWRTFWSSACDPVSVPASYKQIKFGCVVVAKRGTSTFAATLNSPVLIKVFFSISISPCPYPRSATGVLLLLLEMHYKTVSLKKVHRQPSYQSDIFSCITFVPLMDLERNEKKSLGTKHP